MKKHYSVTKPWVAWLFLLPQLIFFSVFTIYPVFEGLRISLYKTTFKSEVFVGLENYLELFQDSVFLNSVKNTIFLVLVIVPISLLVSLFISAAVFDKNPRYIAVIRTTYYLPVIVSTVVMSMVWNFLLNPACGLVPYLVKVNGGKYINFLGNRDWVLWVISLVTIVASLGQGVILFIAAMVGIPHELLEAAMADGATKVKRIYYVVLPLVKPTTLYLFVISTINILKLFVVIQLLTDGGPNNASMTMMYYLYRNAFLYDKSNAAASIGVLMLILAILLVIPQFKVLQRQGTE